MRASPCETGMGRRRWIGDPGDSICRRVGLSLPSLVAGANGALTRRVPGYSAGRPGGRPVIPRVRTASARPSAVRAQGAVLGGAKCKPEDTAARSVSDVTSVACGISRRSPSLAMLPASESRAARVSPQDASVHFIRCAAAGLGGFKTDCQGVRAAAALSVDPFHRPGWTGVEGTEATAFGLFPNIAAHATSSGTSE